NHGVDVSGLFRHRWFDRRSFRRPDAENRARIWRALLPARMPLADDVDVHALARDHELSGGGMKNAILVAVTTAAARALDGTEPIVPHAVLDAAARDQAVGRRVTSADHERVERERESGPATRRAMGFGS